MAFVIVAMTAKMKQVQLVNQTVALQQVHGAVNRDARDVGINLLRTLENFLSVHVTRGAFENFYQNHTLTREANTSRLDLALQMARRLVLVDAFADRRTARDGGQGLAHDSIIASSGRLGRG